MSTLALALLLILTVATVTFYVAGGLYASGSIWARDVCSLSPALCDQPTWLAGAAAIVAILYFLLRLLRL